MDCKEAFTQGVAAQHDGLSRRVNPYPANTLEHQTWNDGYDELIDDDAGGAIAPSDQAAA